MSGFDVRMDMRGYLATQTRDPRPLPPFPHGARADDERDFVAAKLTELASSTLRTSPQLNHPYLAPGAVYDSVWTWDSYFTGLALPDEQVAHFQGALCILLEAVRPDGRVPSLVEPDGTASYDHMGQPVHAQWALAVVRRTGTTAWLLPYWDTLVSIRDWHDRECGSRHGLYTWTDESGTGIDNDPAIYGRPGGTVGLVDMNCFHAREWSAMAQLADLLGKPGAHSYRARASGLVRAINTFMWDARSGSYRHLELSRRHRPTRQEVTWEVPLLVGSWGTLFPLWTGVADPGLADRLIREHVLSPQRYLSGFGIRSMAADEPMYNNEPMADPSNWQGPVWGLSTFLTCYGLARYGYRAEAVAVARRLVNLMADDLRANGTVHEYYHAETGQPLFNPGFVSWNLFAVRILADLDAGLDPTAIEPGS
ncbi:amylo-alpha-1,6-glucosidase [Kribbella sp. NPDC004536]|uniref:amylo-alpha-1,6-glucosidase n=1 Tax=Kribbella sp. NPDC004536 TaxID=3364106 RepID=UPI0036D016C4